MRVTPPNHFGPCATWDGASFVVAWLDGRGASLDVYAARVAPDGRLLDPQGVAISNGPMDEDWPVVSSDGRATLIAWTDPAVALPSLTGGDSERK